MDSLGAITSVFMRQRQRETSQTKEEKQTHRREGGEDGGRVWSDVATSQGILSATRSYLESRYRFSPKASRGSVHFRLLAARTVRK